MPPCFVWLIAKQKKRLQEVGYDCFMIFVNTDLEVALERNQKRERILPSELVKSSIVKYVYPRSVNIYMFLF